MIIELFGTEYKFGFSFFAVLTLMLLTADGKIAAVSLVSSLLHECGHLVFLYIFGERPHSVELGAFGIRIERLGMSHISYKKEAVIAIGGVTVNFILAAAFIINYSITGTVLSAVGVFVNLFIAALNLMPVGMLDAGRFLRYILLMHFDEEKTSAVLERVSAVTVILFTAFCAFYTAFIGLNVSLIAADIYLIFSNLKRR